MDIINDLTLAVFSVLGLVFIVLGLIVPYFIHQIRVDLREIRKKLDELSMDSSSAEPQEKEKARWKKSSFKKI